MNHRKPKTANQFLLFFCRLLAGNCNHGSLLVYGSLVVFRAELGASYQHVLTFCCPSKASHSEQAIICHNFLFFLLPVCQFFICNIFLSITNLTAITSLNQVQLQQQFRRIHTICRPKSALFGANIWAYLKYMQSYSIFCVYISKFSFLWQQGLI